MIYEYRCPKDNQLVEIERAMKDAEEVYTCPQCGGVLERVWNAAPISFKGGGFYVNGG